MRLTGLAGFAELVLVRRYGETLVVRACDEAGVPVLVKTHATHLPSGDARARLRREYEYSTVVDHPHVARARRFVDLPNRVAVVLDDPCGPTLAELVDSRALDLPTLFAVGADIAAALVELHAAGIAHRAVGTDRIVSTERGAVLIDLYDAWPEDHVPRRATHGRHPAPEQLGSSRSPVTVASDQFALGSALSEASAACGLDLPGGVRVALDRATDPDPRRRYRSLLGLRDDLCEWRDQLRVDPRSVITTPPRVECQGLRWEDPDRLVGRERELAEVHRFIHQTADHRTPRVLVIRSAPGMGRSALVAALADQLADASVLSGVGRFLRDGSPAMPLQAPLEAMSQVVALLLAAPDTTLGHVRDELHRRLGDHIGLATRLVPALTALVGEHADPPTAPPEEALDTIEAAVREIVGAVAQTHPPLVTIFDDADRAGRSSLNTLEMLVTQAEVGPLAVVLAAPLRSPRLDGSLQRLRRSGVEVREMVLHPLPPLAVTELISLGTGVPPDEVAPLADAVWARSGGSPAVALTDLWDLTSGGHLTVDTQSGRWRWDDRALIERDPDDLDTVAARRIDGLDHDLRELVAASAIVGRTATTTLLATWGVCDPDEMDRLVDRAVSARVLVRRTGDQLACADEGVRRAALELLAPPDLLRLRRDLATALMGALPSSAEQPLVDDDSRYVLIDLLSDHPDLDWPGPERSLYVHLREEAAVRAHRNAAFPEALEHQLRALAVLDADSWRTEPDRTFELHLRAAEHALILGRIPLVDDLVDRMHVDRLPAQQRVRLLRILGTRAWTRGDGVSGLESLRSVLAELGEPIPDQVGWSDLAKDYLAVRRMLVGREPESFLEAPRLDDDRIAAAFDAMLACVHLAYVGQPLTHMWLVLRGTRLTAQHGVHDASAYFLTGFGMLSLSLPRGIATGLRFGRVGRDLARDASWGTASMVAFAHDAFIRHWGEALGDSVESLESAFQHSIATRRRDYGLTGGTFAPLHALLAGRPLRPLDERAAAAAVDFANVPDQPFQMRVEIVRQVIQDLVDGPGPAILDGKHFDASTWLTAKPRRGELAVIVHTLRGLVAMCAGDQVMLRASTQAAAPLLRTAPGQAVLGRHWFHAAYLDARAVAETERPAERRRRRLIAERSLRRLRELANHAPANAAHRVAFVEALLAEAGTGRRAGARAMDRYEQAVTLATTHGALHDLGVIAEAAAAFHAGRDRVALARHYAGLAGEAWRAWGAEAVAATLADRVGVDLLLVPPTPGDAADGPPAPDPTPETLAEASSLLGEELEVREFLERLIEILMRHTDASRGWLVLQSALGPIVEVAARAGAAEVEIAATHSTPVSHHDDLCEPAVNFVLRSRQVLSVTDPANDRRLRADAALRRRAPRALLGLPVGRTGSTAGVLVLESDNYSHAFEPERIEALRVLSAQAIAAIDQARLRSDLSILADDIAELRDTAAELTTRAETDKLTGVANRAGMEVQLHQLIRSATSPHPSRPPSTDTQVGVLFCDLDDFKQVNDRFGHAAGDRMLVAIAARLTSVTRTDDIVARIGGDEFVVVSVGVTSEELERMAERAVREIAVPVALDSGELVAASMSIGIGRADLGSIASIDDIDQLVEVADQAMYAAKQSGKNQVRVTRTVTP